MLEFLYTDSISSPELLEERADELLKVAEKYGIEPMKEFAERYLVSTINRLTLTENAVLADTYSALILKEVIS
jgi:hypothetical protein